MKMNCGKNLMLIPRCETVCRLVCDFYRTNEKVCHGVDFRAVWGDLREYYQRSEWEDGCTLLGRKSSRRKRRG